MKHWLDAIRDEVKPPEDTPPRGFLNASEVAKQIGLTTRQGASRFCSRAIKAGKMVKVLVRRRTARGIAIVPYYGPKR